MSGPCRRASIARAGSSVDPPSVAADPSPSSMDGPECGCRDDFCDGEASSDSAWATALSRSAVACWLMSAARGLACPMRTISSFVEASRPNLGRATVVSVRLPPGELEQLKRAADAAHLPVSTMVRVGALAHVDASRGDDLADVTGRLARLESAVFDRSP